MAENQMGCEYELVHKASNTVVRYGFVNREEAEAAAKTYEWGHGVVVVVVENWRG